MNKNYLAGYKAERRAVNYLKKEGYTIIRSGKSRTPVDLVAFNAEKIRLIQIKSTKEKKIPSYNEDIQALQDMKIPENATIELWVWESSVGWHFLPVPRKEKNE
jgi:Holliday junction resolvase